MLILADDLGYECIGADGCTGYQTPNLDRLAAGGARFDHCYVQPLCTPTRAQLMTGQYNVRNYDHFGVLDPDQRTLGHVFRDAGYATCVVGKWQLGGGFEGPKHFGFDNYCLWQLTRRPWRYKNPGLEVDGKEIDYTHGEYGPDLVSDYACQFIEKMKDRPFFLYYPMILTHDPYEPTPDSADYATYDPAKSKSSASHYTPKGQRNFGNMVAHMDRIVGKIVAKLEAEGLRDSTLIVFVGDNGTGKGTPTQTMDGVVTGGKGNADDSGMHVPLIVSGPGVGRGIVVRDLVDSTDFLPTLCAATGVTLPTDMTIDGRSFWPQCRGEPGKPRDSIYCWYDMQGLSPPKAEFARNHDFKLYRDGRLFDVSKHDDDKSPLAPASLDDMQKADVAKLQATLDRYRDARPARFEKARGPGKSAPAGD